MKPFLYNTTRKTILAEQGRVLHGLNMALGAMFRGVKGSYVFVWWRETKIAITNLFVPEAIDILWLDRNWRVVDMRASFPPGALRTVNRRPAKYVIELPAGSISQTKTKMGDVILCVEFYSIRA